MVRAKKKEGHCKRKMRQNVDFVVVVFICLTNSNCLLHQFHSTDLQTIELRHKKLLVKICKSTKFQNSVRQIKQLKTVDSVEGPPLHSIPPPPPLPLVFSKPVVKYDGGGGGAAAAEEEEEEEKKK